MAEPVSDRDDFENGFYYFVEAVMSLAGSLNQHRKDFSTEGLAWELRQDVEAGPYLFNLTSCCLSPQQRAGVMQLVEAFQAVPLNIEHPSWVPLRIKAQQLITDLEPITRANRKYFGLGANEL